MNNAEKRINYQLSIINSRRVGFTLIDPSRRPSAGSGLLRVTTGFTLIELLLVTGIIGILASIVIVAVNPGRQLAQARNTQRRGHTNVLLNAINQYQIDHTGTLPTGLNGTLRMLGTALSGCSVSCGSGPPPPSPTTVTINAPIDASIWQFSPGMNFGSMADLWVLPWTPSWTFRFLIRFDLSSIPAGASIVQARIHLHESTTFGVTRTIGGYRATRSWTENGVTWKNAQAGTPWTLPGGDAVGTATATATLTWDGVLGWNTWDVTTDVQTFVNGIQPNHGWLFRDTSEDGSTNFWFFHSWQSPSSSLRPYLNVTYSSGAGGGTETTTGTCLNLTGALIGTYIPEIPVDPQQGSAARSFYATRTSTGGRLLVRACSPELGETIEVIR